MSRFTQAAATMHTLSLAAMEEASRLGVHDAVEGRREQTGAQRVGAAQAFGKKGGVERKVRRAVHDPRGDQRARIEDRLAQRHAVVQHDIDRRAGVEPFDLGIDDDLVGEQPGRAGAGALALAGFDLERRVEEGHGAASIARGGKDKARPGLDESSQKSDLIF